MKHIFGLVAGAGFALAATGAMAVPMGTLTGGGTISGGDVTFGGFDYVNCSGESGSFARTSQVAVNCFGGAASVEESDVEVTVSATAGGVDLDISFAPGSTMVDGNNEFLEIFGEFTATGGAFTTLDSLDVTIFGSVDDNDFVEVGSNLLGEDASFFDGETDASFSASLGGVASVLIDWAVISEAFGAGETNVSNVVFSFSTTTTGAPIVPVPAALPLMLSGLFGMGLIARRRARS